MKESEALEHIRLMLRACQKSRSNTLESWAGMDSTESDLSNIDKQLLESLSPWLFGKGNVVPLLARIVDEGRIEAHTFLNLMTIADRFDMRMSMGIWAACYASNHQWPEPTLDLIREWEPDVSGERVE